jgi:SAM-dependent methyltransferase
VLTLIAVNIRNIDCMGNLFDLSNEYDAMLNEGLRLSGEDKFFFLKGRVADLQKELGIKNVSKILDFGCGIGDSTHYLSSVFTGAKVHGVDTAFNAITHARLKYNQPAVSFELLNNFNADDEYDLCYVNGVFHHIPPHLREDALRVIYKALKPTGMLALFENNPWNPGTRLVMSRISFDKDAILLTPRETRSLLSSVGFKKIINTRFLFYFPRVLSFLRRIEPFLVKVPFGAQYYVLAQKK